MDFGKDLSDYFKSLTDWFGYILSYWVGIISGIADAFFYYLKAGFYLLTNLGFDVLQSVLSGSPIVAKLAYLQSAFTGPLGYFADYFLLPEALTAIFGAYFLRFIIRRIPGLG